MWTKAFLLFIAAMAWLAPQSASAQDVEAGKKVFVKCSACHSATAGQKKVGPSLANVVGRTAGTEPGYNYSVVMRRAGLTWTPDSLDRFLTNPWAMLHGSKMIFSGLKDPNDRANVIAYLQTISAPADAAQQAAAPAQPAAEQPRAPHAMTAGVPTSPAPVAPPPGTGDPTLPQNYSANLSYTLKSGIAEGRMVFIGVGGRIEGIINPTLSAKEGDIVQVTLINGEGAQHDVVFTEPNVRSETVTAKGASTTIAFRAGKVGEFAYFCSLPGHREAGMEGVLSVVAPADVPPAPVAEGPDISLDPASLPPPITRKEPQRVQVTLETVELDGRLAEGTTYKYWTFNGTVPGPFIRVRVGDTVDVTLKNNIDSAMIHSVDFHAATGPGGGAVHTQADPGTEKRVEFKALLPGLYVYHCATPMVAHHITNGMYGLILVEPENGLPPVDREFYVMQGEIYTEGTVGTLGSQEFSVEKLLNERPEYFVFNGNVGALTTSHPLRAKVGQTVRLFVGVGGPNFTSSFHVIGEIFDRVYEWGDVISPPGQGIQTVSVPPGGAVITEFKVDYPGRYLLVDHALSRLERGLVGYLVVEGEADPLIYKGHSEAAGGH